MDNATLPVTLLTGYLGSGKTTLLARLLAHPRFRDTAVLVNEFGEIALDHELLYSAAETIVLMDRGCLCCALRSDLAAQLDELYSRRRRGELPPFQRVVIETTGLADPAPILQTLAAEPTLAVLYRLDGVVTTVDGELGDAQLNEHFESVKQAAAADHIVITKVDRSNKRALEALDARIRRLNPAAPITRAIHGAIEPRFIMDIGLHDAQGKATQVERWLQSERYRPAARTGPSLFGEAARHDARICSFAIVYHQPVSGVRLWQGLEQLIDSAGEKLLRVKGIVNVSGQDSPRVVHIVQHVLYPVTTLPAWPSTDRRTRLVFIVRDLDANDVENVLRDAMN